MSDSAETQAQTTLAGVTGELNKQLEEFKPAPGESFFSGKRLGLVLLIGAGAFVIYTFFIRRKANATASAAMSTDPLPSAEGMPPQPDGGPRPGHHPPPQPPPNRIPPPGGPPVSPPPGHVPPSSVHYVVQPGDTLWHIAVMFHTSAERIYADNQATIDAWAQAHNAAPPYQQHIYPGEILTITPGVEVEHGH